MDPQHPSVSPPTGYSGDELPQESDDIFDQILNDQSLRTAASPARTTNHTRLSDQNERYPQLQTSYTQITGVANDEVTGATNDHWYPHHQAHAGGPTQQQAQYPELDGAAFRAFCDAFVADVYNSEAPPYPAPGALQYPGPEASTALTISGALATTADNDSTQPQSIDKFATEADADAHLSHRGQQVEFAKLKIKNGGDDVLYVSGEQKRQFKQDIVNALLYQDPNAPTPAGVDFGKYAKQQRERLAQCKERLGRRQGDLHAQACAAKLFFIVERLHKDGVDGYMLNKTGMGNANRYSIDWESKFTKRMADIIKAIEENKRVAVDVLDVQGLDELAQNASAYVARKLTNIRGNSNRNYLSSDSSAAIAMNSSSLNPSSQAPNSDHTSFGELEGNETKKEDGGPAHDSPKLKRKRAGDVTAGVETSNMSDGPPPP